MFAVSIPQPNAPRTAGTVGNKRIPTTAYQPEIGQFLPRIVVDQLDLRTPKIRIVLRPVQVVTEQNQLWIGKLAADRIDCRLTVIWSQQFPLVHGAMMDKYRLVDGKLVAERTILFIARCRWGAFAPDGLCLVGELVLALQVTQ